MASCDPVTGVCTSDDAVDTVGNDATTTNNAAAANEDVVSVEVVSDTM
jgi:hypothetical protein